MIIAGFKQMRGLPRAMRVAALVAALLLSLLAGCATHDSTASAPRPGSGAEEYRRLTSESAAGVLEALRRLEDVDAQANRCPPKVVAAFANEVEQLQVESIKVRARAQAIQARGEAYLEAWTAAGNPGIESPPRPAAEHMPQVRESFARIKLISQETGQAFRQFFSDLRQLRADLETDPGVIETAKTKDLIRRTRDHGGQVLRNLGVLRHELQALRPLLVQPQAAKDV